MTTTTAPNVYDYRIHGVCGYPRPAIDFRSASWREDVADATERGRGRCLCDLEVRLEDGSWTHYVAADEVPGCEVCGRTIDADETVCEDHR
jgi:hypothetical protein